MLKDARKNSGNEFSGFFFTILLTLLAPVVSVSVTVLTLTPSFASDPDHWKSLCGPWVPPQDAGLWSECWKVCGEVSPWRLSPSFLSTDCGLLWPHTRQPVSSCSYSNIHSWFFITQCRAADWWSVENSMGIMVCITLKDGQSFDLKRGENNFFQMPSRPACTRHASARCQIASSCFPSTSSIWF